MKNRPDSVTIKTEEKKEDPFAEMDRVITRKDDNPVAIGRVAKLCEFFRGNVPGERVSVSPPEKGVWLSQQGLLRLEISSVRPSELDAAGGVDNFLAANPGRDKMSKQQRRKLPPIPGKAEGETARPWDFVTVD